MTVKKAIVTRINELCKEKDMATNALANVAGITPSTIYSILNPDRKDVGSVTIKKICDGLGISLVEFFDCDLFNDLEQEII